METSKEGKEFIKEHEGLRLKVYLDVAGYGTIGYGHLIRPEDELVTEITKDQAEELFEKDVKKAELCVTDSCKQVALMQNEFDALVSFVFNVGCGAFKDSTLLKELKASRPLQAGMQFGRWVYAGGKVVKGLKNRREAEKRLFIYGEYK